MERRGFLSTVGSFIAGLFGAPLVASATAFGQDSVIHPCQAKCIEIGDELHFGCEGELSSKMSPFRGLSRNSTTAEVAAAISKTMTLMRQEKSAQHLTPMQRFACEQAVSTLWGLHGSITRPAAPSTP